MMWGLTGVDILTAVILIGLLTMIAKVLSSVHISLLHNLSRRQKQHLPPDASRPPASNSKLSNPPKDAKDGDRIFSIQQALNVEESLRHLTGNLLQCMDKTVVLHAALQELAVVLDVVYGNTILYRRFGPVANDDLSQTLQTSLEDRVNAPHAYTFRNNESISIEVVSEYVAGDLDLTGLVISQNQCFEHLSQRLNKLSYQICAPVAALGEQWHTIFFCPILDSQSHLLGDIVMIRSCDNIFNDDEIHFVQQVADQCAIAIRQSTLYHVTQKQFGELERLNHLKDDFLSTISHELRTPMSNIQMGIDALDRHLQQLYVATSKSDHLQGPENDNLHQWRIIHQCIQILKDESQQESALIEDLLNLSRLEAGIEPFLPTQMDLYSWLSHIAEVFGTQAKRQNQKLIINISQPLEPLTTDFALLERIITELLQNACKYTPSGESITISAYPVSLIETERSDISQEAEPVNHEMIMDGALLNSAQGSERTKSKSGKTMMTIQISNTGVEIPQEECDRIFDKFYRIPSNDPWKHRGTGLGLALVRRLAATLKGTIHAVSTNQQVHMILRLPLYPPYSPH